MDGMGWEAGRSSAHLHDRGSEMEIGESGAIACGTDAGAENAPMGGFRGQRGSGVPEKHSWRVLDLGKACCGGLGWGGWCGAI